VFNRRVSVDDVRASVAVVLPALDPVAVTRYDGIEVRRQTDGSGYRGKVVVGSGGAVSVAAYRVAGTAEQFLAAQALPLSVRPGDTVTVQLVSSSSTAQLRPRSSTSIR
jgi:hypothetical protein